MAKRRTVTMSCQQCGERQVVEKIALRRASQPRCMKCGGRMEKTHLLQKWGSLKVPAEPVRKAARQQKRRGSKKELKSCSCTGCGKFSRRFEEDLPAVCACGGTIESAAMKIRRLEAEVSEARGVARSLLEYADDDCLERLEECRWLWKVNERN